jgi:NAD(P)-dependent dehydrogenase (short-subunit alcohol dehydrogenase family)
MAREGADIIAIDICHDIPSNPYPLATPDDLAETERSVKELGRRVVARVADVRERHELREAVEASLADLGHIDIVVANAGICRWRWADRTTRCPSSTPPTSICSA